MVKTQLPSTIEFQVEESSQNHIGTSQRYTKVRSNIKFLQLYQYAEKKDIIFLFFSTVCAIIIGAAFPAFSLLWGSAVDAFQNRDTMMESTLGALFANVKLGFCGFIVGWIMHTFFMISAASQGGKCRNLYLKSVMAQEVGWFQTQDQSILGTQLSSLAVAFEGAIGENISNVLSNVFLLIFGVFLAFINRWELSIVIICVCPFLIYFWYLMIKIHVQSEKFEEESRNIANSKAEEVIYAIKTVKQLNSIEFQKIKYERTFDQTTKDLQKHVRKLSNIQFAANFFFFGIFALAFWYGCECVKGSSFCPASPRYSGGDILGILFCLLIPALNLQQLFPSLKAIGEGKEAFSKIKKVIDRNPRIYSLQEAIIPSTFSGVFQFQNVFFSYPKDKTRIILKGLTLEINCKNTGIMGPSGTGKSTIFQLMMRLYDPDEGNITLDGVNLKKINLNWLREQISYVGQQPMLFSSSIRQNLLVGKPNASEEELFSALRKAEIADFVEGLKDGLQTYVGNGGCQLSGGQKQRLAIARALLKDPRIILFDEASSALDIRNERLIQETITRFLGEKIIISIAHRVTTIQNCDQICIIEQGRLYKKIKNIQEITIENFNRQKEPQQHNPQDQNCSVYQFESINYLPQQYQTASQFILKQQFTANQQAEEKSYLEQNSPFIRLLKYSANCKKILISGIICAFIHGLILPMIGLQLGRIISMCLQYDENPELYSSKIQTQTKIMALITVFGAIVNKLQYRYFLTIGVRVNSLLEIDIYDKLLRLPISWFDKSENNPSKIVSKVLKDGKIVKELFSLYLPHLSLAISSIVFGLMMALYCQWRTAIVAIILMPFIGGISALQSSFMYGNNKNTNEIYKESGKTLSQSIHNIKSIQSFCCENYVLKCYESTIQKAVKFTTKKSIFAGFMFGLSYLILYSIYGIIFYVSSIFIVHNNLEIIDALSAVFLISFTGIVAGSNLKIIPNLVSIRISAISIFNILDSIDEEQMCLADKQTLKVQNIKGKVEFVNVSFRYPSRLEWALKSVSFCILDGEKVALVGTSGSGKSTVIQLLLRFYEPNEGSILLDGIDLRKYELSSLRRFFGVVNQEPTLFDETVRYNITYGNQGASEQQLSSVSRLFPGIEQSSGEWSNFLERKVGPRGSHISGGQKQRVAIARLALRSPSVLLLDEATSALDAQNVALVEECLTKIIDGKTVINITHNLQSLKDYNLIIILEKGQKIDEGSFDFLQSKNSQFLKQKVQKEI